jgi:hypothetical protein
MRRAPAVDLMIYVRALGLLVRNPSIIVVPLMMGLVGVFAGLVFSGDNNPIGVVTTQLAFSVVLLLNLFGFGTATILADQAWRRGRTSFDDGWTEARRKAPEILMASLGFTFVLFIAQYVAAIFGALGLLLVLAAVVFLIYTIPAAAIGGVPGGASIQVSIDRTRAHPLPAVVAAIVAIAAYMILPSLFFLMLANFGVVANGIVGQLLVALVKAVAIGYIALVVGKTYSDVSFGRY